MSGVKINPLRGIAVVVLAIVMPLSFLASCFGKKNEIVALSFDPQTSYTSKEVNTKALLSRAGKTILKLEADTRLEFGKASPESYWHFPDGIYIEKFDSLFEVEVNAVADTAFFYERRKIWELKGNVDIISIQGDRIQTAQFFYDTEKGTFYSDSFTRYTKGENINTGIGFKSKEDMSEFEFYKSTAEFIVESQQNTSAGDTIPPDPIGYEILNMTDSTLISE